MNIKPVCDASSCSFCHVFGRARALSTIPARGQKGSCSCGAVSASAGAYVALE